MALTAKRVAKFTEAGRYGDGHGLYLQVTPTGVRSWLLRYERGGRERWMGLGPLHTFGLDEARARARQARQQLADGVDPRRRRSRSRMRRGNTSTSTRGSGRIGSTAVNFERRCGTTPCR